MFSTSLSWKWLISSFLFLSALHASQAQVFTETHYELPISSYSKLIDVKPSTGKDDLLLYFHTNLINQDENLMSFIMLDSALEETWRQQLLVPKFMHYLRNHSSDHRISYLFISLVNYNFLVIDIDMVNGEFEVHQLRNHLPLYTTHFISHAGSILVGGEYNNLPVVFYFNRSSGKSLFLPNIFSRQGTLCDIEIGKKETLEVLTNTSSGRMQVMTRYKFDDQGKMIESQGFFSEKRKSLQDGRLVHMGSATYVIGTFGHKRSEFSKGIFTADLSSGKEIELNFKYWDELDNYFNYLRPKRKQRIMRRIERRKDKDKHLMVKSRVRLNDVIQKEGETILTAEAYYPDFRLIETQWNYSTTGTRQVFDGFNYTHAMLIGIDSTGGFRWDNSMPLDNFKTFTLESPLNLADREENLILYFQNRNTIQFKEIRKGETIMELTSMSLSQEENEQYQFDGFLTGQKNFYAYGFKGEQGGAKAGKIFFINKLSL